MNTRFTQLILWLFFMAVSGLAVLAASPEERLVRYQDEIKARPSGVYEVNGDLYVHVRIPLKNAADLSKTKLKSVLTANELLKKWAVDISCPARSRSESATEGIRFAASVADACDPAWRFADWNVKSKGQEVSRYEKNDVIFCLILPKEEMVKQIPPSFLQPIPQKTLFNSLRNLVAALRKRDPAKLYGICNAMDLGATSGVTQQAKEEYGAVADKVKKYLASSSFAAGLRCRAERIRERVSCETWVELEQNPGTKKTEQITVVTNIPAVIAVVTNFLTRAETKEERARLGVVAHGEMTDEVCVSDEAEIVETRVVTTETVVKTIRRKNVRTTIGIPEFEDVFVSGGEKSCKARPQTESGRRAVAAFFDTVTLMDGKEKCIHDALCENPGDTQLWNLYGRCLMHRSDIVGALICFRIALKLDTNNPYALTNLAICYESMRCMELARGMAVLAYGASDDGWCVRESRKVLLRP